MSSRFDLALVVSKATSLASSSCTSDDQADTATPLCCKLASIWLLPGRDTAPARLHKQGYFGTLKIYPGSNARCPLLAPGRHAQCAGECPLLGVKRTFLIHDLTFANDPWRTTREEVRWLEIASDISGEGQVN